MRLNIKQLEEGMVLAEPVQAQGRTLLASGVKLTQKHLHIFNAWGVTEAIVEGDSSTVDDNIDPDSEELNPVRIEIEKRFEKCDNKNEIIKELKRIAFQIAVEKYLIGKRNSKVEGN